MPASLRDEVVRMLDRHGPFDGGVPHRLAAAALAGLADVLAGPGDRSSAGRLLAADALLTYACEAAGEAGPDAVDRLVRELSPARFDELLTGPDETG